MKPKTTPSIQSSRLITRTFSSGPLPPAAEIEQYEKTMKGAFNRILAMAERSQAERHEERVKQIESVNLRTRKMYSNSIIAMIFAFSLCGICLVISAFLIYKGQPLAGTVFGAPSFIAILRYFLGPLREKSKERDSERDMDPSKK